MIAAQFDLTPGDPTAVAAGRALVVSALEGIAGGPGGAAELPRRAVDDVVLAASELVTNAVAAGNREVRLVVETDERAVRLSVYDDGPGLPVALPASPDRPHGRGMRIVEAVAACWGVSPEPPGKWVWAEFPADATSAAAS